MKRPLIVLAAAAALAACTTSTSPDVINRQEAQYLSTVIDAVVLTTRAVTVDGTQSGIGAMTGSVMGGIAGSNVGGYRDAAVVGMIGAVLGGLIGNAAERASTKEEAIEILMQLRNGERRSVVQARSTEAFAPGDSVILITTGRRVRVTKAPVVIMPASPAPAASAASTT